MRLTFSLPRRGTYTGRLAFDPDTLFHVDPDGRRVVTLDGGMTWRYARRSDVSHNARYQRRLLVVDGTANAATPEPHHYQVQPDDPHAAGLLTHPDVEAAVQTSHTDAWKEQT